MHTRITIIAKAPLPGLAKTRLIPALGEQGAADLAQAMLQHAVSAALQTQVLSAESVSVGLCRTPFDHLIWESLPLASTIIVTDQGTGDLGQRMLRAVQRGLLEAQAVILMGTDCPALDSAQLQQAIAALQNHDAVMIPALDGGYVALGLRRCDLSLFTNIAWSTPQVAQVTLERIRALGWSVEVLSPLADIDEPSDLLHLPPDWPGTTIKKLDFNDVERILVFGGVYGNLPALEAMLIKAQSLGIAPQHMVCTGDILAYCAQPNECIDLIRDNGIAAIAGNCETAIAQNQNDCGCGFGDGSACQLLSDNWFVFNQATITPERRAYLATLPAQIELVFAGRKWLVLHGSTSAANTFVFASNASAALQNLPCHFAGVIGGHSGIPFTHLEFTHLEAGRVWHNSGALGMPANDGTARVWFSTFTQSQNHVVIEHHALEYATASTQSAMLVRGLDTPYRTALISGIWPSQDILPETEKQQVGKPLAPSSITLPGCNPKPITI